MDRNSDSRRGDFQFGEGKVDDEHAADFLQNRLAGDYVHMHQDFLSDI